MSNITSKDIVKDPKFIEEFKGRIKTALCASVRELVNANVAHTFDKANNLWIDMIRSSEDALAVFEFKTKVLEAINELDLDFGIEIEEIEEL